VIPAAQGQRPKFTRQFRITPPTEVLRVSDPLLPIEPTLFGNAQIKLPNVNLPNWGDPMASPGPLSNGPGSGNGIGPGHGDGIGPGKGPGYGPGEEGGVSGMPSGTRGSITAPVVLVKIEPEYTEDARRARITGTVILRIEVGTDGKARNISVRQSLGLGLDERAVEAVQRWKFAPGKQNGQPVVTVALVEVNFRLL
jgi:periplasmic protein TonB